MVSQPIIRLLLCALFITLLSGCGDRPDTSALNMPPPTPVESREAEPAPTVPPKSRLSMNATKVGPVILQGIQVGALQAGTSGTFEIALFDAVSWPGRPQAWVGDVEPVEESLRFGKELPGKAYEFILPLPSPISSSNRLWIRIETAPGEYVSGAFKLQR